MSAKSKKTKVVKTIDTQKKPKSANLQKSKKVGSKAVSSSEFIFGKKNFLYLGLSFLVICLGLLLMSGGVTDYDTWNPDQIYSFRRITLAPIVILGGFCLAIYAIFAPKS